MDGWRGAARHPPAARPAAQGLAKQSAGCASTTTAGKGRGSAPPPAPALAQAGARWRRTAGVGCGWGRRWAQTQPAQDRTGKRRICSFQGSTGTRCTASLPAVGALAARAGHLGSREEAGEPGPAGNLPGMPPSSWKGSSSQIKGWSWITFLCGRATPSPGLETQPREEISLETAGKEPGSRRDAESGLKIGWWLSPGRGLCPNTPKPCPGSGSAGGTGRWGSRARPRRERSWRERAGSEPAGEVSCRRSRTSGTALPAGSAGDGGRPAPLARIGGTMSPLCRRR